MEESLESIHAKMVEDILNEAKSDRIIIMTVDGHRMYNMEDFINQPVDGILYDLNRDFATLTNFALNSKSLKFVNDFAAAYTIKYLKGKLDEANRRIEKLDKYEPKFDNEIQKFSNKIVNNNNGANQIKEGFNIDLEINM